MKKKSEVNIFYEKSKWAGHGHFIRSERLYRSLKKRGYYGKIYCNKNSNEINNIIKKYKKNFFLVLDYKNYDVQTFKYSNLQIGYAENKDVCFDLPDNNR